MQPLPLPRDVRRHVRKKAIVYIIKLLLWEAAVAAVNMAIWTYLIDTPVIHVPVVTASLLLPFLFIGLPKDFFHSTVVGTVTSVHIKEETGSYRVGVRYWPYTKHVILLDVETQEGKQLRVKAREYGMGGHQAVAVPFEGDIQRHLNDYTVGDTVYRYRGLALPYVVTQSRRNTRDCIVCGSENPADKAACHYCGHTLLSMDRHEKQS